MRYINRAFVWTAVCGSLLLAGNVFGAVEFKILMSFGETNGSNPQCLVQGKDGNIYGTTLSGNPSMGGTVFRITSSGEFKPIASFPVFEESELGNSLLFGTDGNFYGTTSQGGTGVGGVGNYGRVFKLTPAGKLTTLASLDITNGNAPVDLLQGLDGNFYGIAQTGGLPDDLSPVGHGTVFKVSPDGELSTVFAFSGTNGHTPVSLIQGTDGNLYGTTAFGGSAIGSTNEIGAAGTVFQLTTNGNLTVLYEFRITNGTIPNALLQGADGNLYGTTYSGGANNKGIIFKLTTNGTLSTLHTFSQTDPFTHNLDGANPSGKLFQGKDGCLYGGTEKGGTNRLSIARGVGTLYKITTNGDFLTLYSFGALTNYQNTIGSFPNGVLQVKGDFVGTTLRGGVLNPVDGFGTVFKLTSVRPILAITKHETGNSDPAAVTVSGKAQTKFGAMITDVFYQLNDGSWTNATTTDEWAHWSADVTLLPGQNIFRAYAVDSAGDVSHTNSVKLRLRGK